MLKCHCFGCLYLFCNHRKESGNVGAPPLTPQTFFTNTSSHCPHIWNPKWPFHCWHAPRKLEYLYPKSHVQVYPYLYGTHVVKCSDKPHAPMLCMPDACSSVSELDTDLLSHASFLSKSILDLTQGVWFTATRVPHSYYYVWKGLWSRNLANTNPCRTMACWTNEQARKRHFWFEIKKVLLRDSSLSFPKPEPGIAACLVPFLPRRYCTFYLLYV